MNLIFDSNLKLYSLNDIPYANKSNKKKKMPSLMSCSNLAKFLTPTFSKITPEVPNVCISFLPFNSLLFISPKN